MKYRWIYNLFGLKFKGMVEMKVEAKGEGYETKMVRPKIWSGMGNMHRVQKISAIRICKTKK